MHTYCFKVVYTDSASVEHTVYCKDLSVSQSKQAIVSMSLKNLLAPLSATITVVLTSDEWAPPPITM